MIETEKRTSRPANRPRRASRRQAFQISLHEVTAVEAENLLVKFWEVLTAHSLPTSLLRIEQTADGQITIDATFDEAADTAVAWRALRDLRRGSTKTQRSP